MSNLSIHPISKKKVLILSSHNLSDYQQCAHRYKESTLYKVEPAQAHKPFTRGTIWSKCMEHYYNAKLATGDKPVDKQIIKDIMATQIPSDFPEEERDLLELRFMQYYGKFKLEPWVPIACEPELLKIFYEDDEFLFVWSGHPDLVTWADYRKKQKLVTDHKTYTRKTRYYFYNNQVRGYLWLAGTLYFVYNYAGFQTEYDKNQTFFRDGKMFDESDIKKWYDDTLWWFFKIARDSDYRRSWQCEGKWGVCWYNKICEQHTIGQEDEVRRLQFRVNKVYETLR